MPICFISQTLSGAETRYGPTELEIAALVWAMKRLKAYIGLSEGSLIVFIDYLAIKQIYNLHVFYIPKKKNFIPNAFSCLKALETNENVKRLYPDYTALDDIVDNKPVDANRLNGEDAVSALKRGMPFTLKDRLLYYK
ncbi:unnamed protein product [Fusarium fujikuroi]|uniref:Reverse transcriptase RNase H-like domain-containing protein n=1 Tax=Fusarium fujikuroi TaxID=5127 RepID=A0A9Q9UBM7_FUSFU|nr:unnamed protein product [Fusarium fujikuroi]